MLRYTNNNIQNFINTLITSVLNQTHVDYFYGKITIPIMTTKMIAKSRKRINRKAIIGSGFTQSSASEHVGPF